MRKIIYYLISLSLGLLCMAVCLPFMIVGCIISPEATCYGLRAFTKEYEKYFLQTIDKIPH